MSSPPDDDEIHSITLSICQTLMQRLERYALHAGSTPEAILLQSIESFLDAYPLPDQDTGHADER